MNKKGKKFDYFDAFERQAALAVKESELLIEIIKNFTTAEAVKEIMPRAQEIEHEGDEICHDMYTAIATDFITPIEREDIIQLTQYLDDIVDYIEDVVQRFYMYDIHFMHENATEFARLINKSCKALEHAMVDFRDFKKSKTFRQSIIDVNTYEEEADEYYMKTIRDLHTKDRDNALRVLVWTQVFACMEKVTDACEHTADTMRSIMLKNS
ncbi:MAG: DUF47 family protein [Raoultibacter sp.]